MYRLCLTHFVCIIHPEYVSFQLLCVCPRVALLQYIVVQSSVVHCSAVKGNVVQLSVVQCSVVQLSIVQWSVLQLSVVQCSVVQLLQCRVRRTLGWVDYLHHVMERFARDFSIWMFRQEVGVLLLYNVQVNNRPGVDD